MRRPLLNFIKYFGVSILGLSFPGITMAEYDMARLARAGGQYVAASQNLWHLKNSECGDYVEGNYGYRVTLREVEVPFKKSDRLALHDYIGSIEWQLKNQKIYYTINSVLNSEEIKGKREEKCVKIHAMYLQIFNQSKENWDYTVQYFSR